MPSNPGRPGMISEFAGPLLVTFIYPEACRYLPFLADELNRQTSTDFGIIVFNDGVAQPDSFFTSARVPFEVISMPSVSPVQIRFEALRILSAARSDTIIFQDSDDGLSPNRVGEVSCLLDEYPLVVNDLDVMDAEGGIITMNLWTDRLGAAVPFGSEDLWSSNFAGFGNTAIRTELLRYLPTLPQEDLPAPDWFVFYTLLYNSGQTGLFCGSCTTRYRQHARNAIGIQNETRPRKVQEARALHYRALQQAGIPVSVERSSTPSIHATDGQPLFWWEQSTAQ